MPYINIWEQDNSGIDYTGNELVVFVPGKILPQDKDGEAIKLDKNNCLYILPYNGRDVTKNIPYSISTDAVLYNYIAELLKAGLLVLYWYNSGFSNTLTDLNFLLDKNAYNVKFLTSGKELICQTIATTKSVLGTYNFTYKVLTNVYSAKVKINSSSTDDIKEVVGTYFDTNLGTHDLHYSGTAGRYVSDTHDIGTISAPNVVPYVTVIFEDYNVTGIILDDNDSIINVVSDKVPVNPAASASLKFDLLDAMIDIAEKRADCAVIGNLWVSEDSTHANFITAVKTELDSHFKVSEKGKYAALFSSLTTLDDATTFADLAYLVAFGNAVKNNNLWDAIANTSRGLVKDFNKLNTVSKYDLDTLIQNESGCSFNGVTYIRPTGCAIWGDRTLLYNKDENIKATGFLSIRNMISDIAKVAYSSAVRYTFDTNNDITWTNFKGNIMTLLDQMVANYKLSTYKIFKTAESVGKKIACEIHISPYGPVEDFDIGIIIDNASIEVTSNA